MLTKSTKLKVTLTLKSINQYSPQETIFTIINMGPISDVEKLVAAGQARAAGARTSSTKETKKPCRDKEQTDKEEAGGEEGSGKEGGNAF